MKLFINAFNLSSAGGLNVALNFLSCLKLNNINFNIKIKVLAPPNCGYEQLADESMEIIYVPKRVKNIISRLLLEYYYIPKLINTWNPDIIFSLGNLATIAKGVQVVLLHYPHIAYPKDPDVRRILDIKTKLIVYMRNLVFESRLSHVDLLLVQTQTIHTRIKNIYSDITRIGIMPNAYTRIADNKEFIFPFTRKSGTKYILCLTRYYRHKNIEVLLDVANIFKKLNMNYCILLTLEATQHAYAKKLLDKLKICGLDDFIINLGEVNHNSIPSLYQKVDGLILPTLLESFSATYVDAMYFKVPIFTSNKDFAYEICQDSAYYFDPLSPEEIVKVLIEAFNNPIEMSNKLTTGEKISNSLPDWNQVTINCLNVIMELNAEICNHV